MSVSNYNEGVSGWVSQIMMTLFLDQRGKLTFCYTVVCCILHMKWSQINSNSNLNSKHVMHECCFPKVVDTHSQNGIQVNSGKICEK